MYGYDGDGYGGMGDGWSLPDITILPGMGLAKEYSMKFATSLAETLFPESGTPQAQPEESDEPSKPSFLPPWLTPKAAKRPSLDPNDPFREKEQEQLPPWVIPVGVGAAALVIGLLILRARSKR